MFVRKDKIKSKRGRRWPIKKPSVYSPNVDVKIVIWYYSRPTQINKELPTLALGTHVMSPIHATEFTLVCLKSSRRYNSQL